jgi:hypothetical protein
MPPTPFAWGKALGLAVLIWLAGFIWGMVVFMVPALKEIPSIPYVSRYPAISFPLLVVFAVLAYLFAGMRLNEHERMGAAGFRLGLTFAVVNFLLDHFVLVAAFNAGRQFYASVTVWLAYAILLIVPWTTGHRMERADDASLPD